MEELEQQKAKWEQQKAKGKARFVLMYTALWILLAIVLESLYLLIFSRSFFHHIVAMIMSYGITVVFMGVVGTLLGIYYWQSNKKKFGPQTDTGTNDGTNTDTDTDAHIDADADTDANTNSDTDTGTNKP